jgi:hypothetical protein
MLAPIALHYFYHDTRYILICTERQISAVQTGHTDKVGNLQKKDISLFILIVASTLSQTGEWVDLRQQSTTLLSKNTTLFFIR